MGLHKDERLHHRNDALVNGALIALGAMAIVDNVVVHWALGLHRAVPGPNPLPVEVGLVVLGAALLTLGVWRERRVRRAAAPRGRGEFV
jgi:uncharacterized membrane protein